MAQYSPPPHPSAPPPVGAAPPFAEEPFYVREEDGIDLRELLDILLRGRWIILAAVLAVAIPVLIWSVLQDNQYRSYSLLLVEKQDSDLASVLPGGANPLLFRNERNLANEILVLQQSMPLAERAARRLMEFGSIPETGGQMTILRPVVTEVGERAPTELEIAFRLQSRYVSVAQQGQDADALNVSAVSTNPDEAALIANVYAESFVDLSQEQSRSGVRASRQFLENQVSDRGEELQQLDSQVRSFMLREQAVALDAETSRIVDQLATLEAQRDAAAVEAQMAAASVSSLQSELSRIEPRLSDRVASGADAQIAAAQERVVELQGELETYYRRNPEFRDANAVPEAVAARRQEIQRLQSRIRTLSDELTRESIAAGGGGPGDTQTGFRRVVELRRQLTDQQIALDGLRAQQQTLTRQINELEADLQAIPGQSIELAQLQRERMAAERLYGALDARLQEARVTEQSQLGYASVIRPAFAASEAFAPNRMRNVALGILLGLMLGAAIAIGKVRLDHRIYRPDDLKHRDPPLLGTIPDTTELIEDDFKGAETVEVGGRTIDTHLVTLLNPMATASETYRALRTSVQFSRPDTVIRTLLVTSSNPGEGKSTTAANLAVVMAQAGRRVLLVDADLRKPSIHKKLGVSRDPGLVQVMFNEEPFTPSAATEIADDLFVLAAGSFVPNPSELLGSRKMREFLAQAHEHFDLVILDTPPVLAATDSVLIATQVDASIVVARAGQTRDYDLESALSALRSVGAPVIGTLLNGFDISQAYGYKYKYAYRYGQQYAYGHSESGAS